MGRLMLIGLIAISVALPAAAERLDTSAGDASRLPGARQPHRGTTMDTVRSRLGQPQRVRAAIGDPPITRWEYSAFTVYFETNRVIHTVMRH